MFRHLSLHRYARLKATLAAICAVVILATTTPCAMAVENPPGAVSDHDCPHCPPQPCHEASTDTDCESLSPVDKPRSDSGPEILALASQLPSWAKVQPAQGQVSTVGHPPARAGPRRHLILVTFNE